MTFTARDDDREEGDEEIRLSVTHDGDAIGSGTIRIVDRSRVRRWRSPSKGSGHLKMRMTAGIATGPFTTRITFSERVEGFTREDIDWADALGDDRGLHEYRSTALGLHGGSRGSGVHGQDDARPRSGRLWIVVHPGAATSVATGDGNQLGANSLQVDCRKAA